MTRFIMACALVLAGTSITQADTNCRADRYQSNTLRCDNGDVWRKDRYGSPTWRSNDGTVIREDRYTGSWKIEKDTRSGTVRH